MIARKMKLKCDLFAMDKVDWLFKQKKEENYVVVRKKTKK